MATVTSPIILDSTGKGIQNALETQSLLLGAIAGQNLDITSWREIRAIVRQGIASKVFSIGDQLSTKWKDENAVEYTFPFDIVSFRNVTLADGSVVPGMVLQLHYSIPKELQFDAYEAFYSATSELAAGTYNFVIDTTRGCAIAGTYQFTLASAVPVGGQLCFDQYITSTAPSAWTVSSFSGPSSTVAIETVAVSSGSGGTSLGSLVPAGNSTLNSIHRAGDGYNRWSQSAYRQYLNSGAAAGAWWKAQNVYDRAEKSAATIPGFLSGFDEDFLSILTLVKVQTLCNIQTDRGVTDVTYDRFFLPSLEEMYISPEVSGVEGSYWEYWRQRSQLTAPASGFSTYDQYKIYAVGNHKSAQTVRLRSAYRDSAGYAWNVSSSGFVGFNIARYEFRCAPACVIC